jgi:ABC-type uncharacterized transport system permease subunit
MGGLLKRVIVPKILYPESLAHVVIGHFTGFIHFIPVISVYTALVNALLLHQMPINHGSSSILRGYVPEDRLFHF